MKALYIFGVWLIMASGLFANPDWQFNSTILVDPDDAATLVPLLELDGWSFTSEIPKLPDFEPEFNGYFKPEWDDDNPALFKESYRAAFSEKEFAENTVTLLSPVFTLDSGKYNLVFDFSVKSVGGDSDFFSVSISDLTTMGAPQDIEIWDNEGSYIYNYEKFGKKVFWGDVISGHEYQMTFILKTDGILSDPDDDTKHSATFITLDNITFALNDTPDPPVIPAPSALILATLGLAALKRR